MVLIVHHDSEARKAHEKLAVKHHPVVGASNVNKGLKAIRRHYPAVGLAGIEAKQLSALTLLKFLKDNRFDIPLLLVANADAGQYQQVAMKLGAKAFLEYPLDQPRFDAAVSMALQDSWDAKEMPVPIAKRERKANLSQLETDLNKQMKCFAGKNQVFLQSMIVGLQKTKPRICLKCPLRREFGLTERVYYEYIRDICVAEPDLCPAVQKFQARTSA